MTGFFTLALLATLMLIVGYVMGRIFNPVMLATVFDLYNIEMTQQLTSAIELAHQIIENVGLYSQYFLSYIFLAVIDYFGSRVQMGKALKVANTQSVMVTTTVTTSGTQQTSGQEELPTGDTFVYQERVDQMLYGS